MDKDVRLRLGSEWVVDMRRVGEDSIHLAYEGDRASPNPQVWNDFAMIIEHDSLLLARLPRSRCIDLQETSRTPEQPDSPTLPNAVVPCDMEVEFAPM